MLTIRPSRPDDIDALFDAWYAAVVATHDFVSAADLAEFSAQVRVYLPTADLTVADVDGVPVGFMVLTGSNVDALFIHPSHHGVGIGRRFLEDARAEAGPLTVDVNEQNTGGCAFYRRMGFEQVGRSELDDGKPYPLLHLAQR